MPHISGHGRDMSKESAFRGKSDMAELRERMI